MKHILASTILLIACLVYAEGASAFERETFNNATGGGANDLDKTILDMEDNIKKLQQNLDDVKKVRNSMVNRGHGRFMGGGEAVAPQTVPAANVPPPQDFGTAPDIAPTASSTFTSMSSKPPARPKRNNKSPAPAKTVKPVVVNNPKKSPAPSTPPVRKPPSYIARPPSRNSTR